MDVQSHLNNGANLLLTQAILLYTDHHTAMATTHDVAHIENVPTMLPGQCLTHEALEELLRSLSNNPKRNQRSILPAEVLCADEVLMAWWKPAIRLPLFLNTKDEKTNKELSGKEVLHPPLVLLARPGRLSICALAENVRPTPETKLYRAPYGNLYPEGNMCLGNVRLPQTLQPRDIPMWEKGFYETNFTHSNTQGAQMTKYVGGHDALWRQAQNWSEEYLGGNAHAEFLVPMKMTLQEAVNK